MKLYKKILYSYTTWNIRLKIIWRQKKFEAIVVYWEKKHFKKFSKSHVRDFFARADTACDFFARADFSKKLAKEQ